MKKLRKNKKGFTLVEVVVVLVIIAILIAIAVPAVMKYVDDANDAKYEAQARGAYIAAETAIVKDYAEDGDIDYLIADDAEGALTGENTLNAVISTQIDIPVTIAIYSDKDAGTLLKSTESPNKAKVYKITLTNSSKTVTIEKNGKVSVE